MKHPARRGRCPGRTSASRAHVDDRGAQLREPSSESSGCGRYRVSVTTMPRTASPRNSSRSLCGSPPALVGVGAVGQRAGAAARRPFRRRARGEPSLVGGKIRAAHRSGRQNREDLLAVVLAAVSNRRCAAVLLTAGAVRAGDEGRRGRLPLRPARASVAARLPPLRNGHGGYSCFVWSKAASAAQRGSIICACGRPPAHPTAFRSRGTAPGNRAGTAASTAGEHHDITHHRFRHQQVADDPVDLVRLGRLVGDAVAVGEQLTDFDVELIGDRVEGTARTGRRPAPRRCP